MAMIRAARGVAADPASVALLMAGPTAGELFADETALAGAGVSVEIGAPHRAGVGFAAGLSVTSSDRPAAWGSVTIHPATDGSELTISLQTADTVNAASLRHWLSLALTDFATAAQARSSAA